MALKAVYEKKEDIPGESYYENYKIQDVRQVFELLSDHLRLAKDAYKE